MSGKLADTGAANDRLKSILSCRWLWLAAFIAVWCALRVFWLTCDTGIPSMWEYGFHVTDEGYYASGGKEMFLWGSFVDAVRREALTYCYSYGTHWLSYVAYLLFGLSTWTWRLPFFAVYFIGWLAMFRHVSRSSGSAFAFATCTAVALLPIVVTYERGMSNDALIAALLVVAYVLGDGRGRWRLAASAFATSLIATVKPSVWVLALMVLGGVLMERKTRSRWLDAAVFLALLVACVLAWKGISVLTVLAEARNCGMSPWKVLAAVNCTYPLPSISDILWDLRAVASFPRDPSIRVVGAVSVMISAVPAAMFAVNVARRRWNGHLLLYASVVAYAYAVNVINSMYSHYFLPLLVMLPVVFSAFRDDCADLASERVGWRKLLVSVGIAAAAVCVAVLLLSSAEFDVRKAADLYSRIHNLPQKNPWLMTWPFVAAGASLGVVAVALHRGRTAFVREGWMWGAVFFLAVSAAFAALPGAVIARHIRQTPDTFYVPMALTLVVGCLLVYLVFARTQVFAVRGFAAAALAVPVFASYLVLPSWRSAAVELVSKRTFYDRDVARELEKLVPGDAIVMGERSNQAFMSIPVRTATMFNFNSNPLPAIEDIRKRDPDAKIYGFFDSQHAYCLQNMQKCADKYRLALLKQFKMPSFADGRLADVYLCRIIPLDPPAK